MNHAHRPDDPTVTIVVPARNEARNLELILPTLPDVHEVIVVDGHSEDDTEKVVARVLPSATFIQQTRRGKGNALACGFEAATGDIVVMFDADGSADAAEIAAFVSTLVAGADFAKGSRVLGDGGSEDITWLRDLGNRVLTGITNRLFRTRYTDLCYGYNAFWRDILPTLAVPRTDAEGPQWGDGFEIETLINIRIATSNLQVHEVASVELRRIHGESNLNTFRDGVRVLRTILAERTGGPATAFTPCADTIRHVDDAAYLHLEAHGEPVLRSLAPVPAADAGDRALVVGPGWRFTSGISYYTCSLTNAMSHTLPTDALLMRQLIPTALYPGRRRVGHKVNAVDYADDVEVYDGVDWFWGRSMTGASRFLDRQAPRVVVLQWWTGAVLHTYLRLARQARRQGAKVIMEWHEVQDTGEVRIPGVRRYVSRLMRRLLTLVDAHVVHSHFDLDELNQVYDIEAAGAPVAVIPHGPYDHVRGGSPKRRVVESAVPVAAGTDPRRVFQLLFFGVIRPYKGLEDLVQAFGSLPADVRDGLHLTIVGETWEGWDAPLAAVETSPARDQITVVNRYVTDQEAQRHFAAADAVVLPYRRSSASGPLHMAMSAGLPVVVTSVGGLVEAAAGYEGARFVPPSDVPALADAINLVRSEDPRRYADVRSWEETVASYGALFDVLSVRVATAALTDVDALDPVS